MNIRHKRLEARASLSPAAIEVVQIITPDHPHYPPLLQEIPDPPARLYVRGDTTVLAEVAKLAVVGSRRGNHLGRRALDLVLPPTSAARLTIVSGLAYGIDAMAHRCALGSGGRTIGVLGSGVDGPSIYPKRHRALADQIIESGGAIISEYESGRPALAHQFPARNRIIAGMCQATLIVQAAARSGSLITARLALEYGREVWAIPGAISDPLSQGTNLLIQQGAAPILQPQDITDLFGLTDTEPAADSAVVPLTPDQEKIVSYLNHEPKHIDTVAQVTGLPAAQLSALLLELEFANVIEHIGNQKYVSSKHIS